jgi:peptide/nickel transport system permease protein
MPDSKRRPVAVLLRAAARLVMSLLITGFMTTCMIRLAPGFGADERELDSRLSAASIDELKRDRNDAHAAASYYRLLKNAAAGDLGFSEALNRPVLELIQQRYATTVRILFLGWGLAWTGALIVSAVGVILQSPAVRLSATAAAGVVLCIPSALLAYLCYLARTPAFAVVALVVFARVFRVTDNLFRGAQSMPHILAARAQGVSERKIFVRHILSATLAELIALAGASVAIAVSATIAAEALCDQPGLGQLAWKAALGRDLPLLVSLTFIIGTVTLVFNRAADALVELRRPAA